MRTTSIDICRGIIMTVWKITWRLLAMVLLVGNGVATLAADRQCPPAPAELTPADLQQLATQASDRGFLWKISKGGHDSWLYGTMHIAKLDWIMPGPKVMRALQRSDVIALELDVTDPATIEKLQNLYRRGAGRIPDSLRPRVKAQLERVCMPQAMMSEMNPALLIMTVQLLAGRDVGLEAAYGIDSVLAGFGHGTNKTVVSLETPESQMASIMEPDGSVKAEELDEALRQLEQRKTAPLLARTADIWARSDLAEMNRYASWCECMETPVQRDEMKRVLDDRNGPLADSIDALHRQGKSVFGAVGALHMIGDNGLPALLAAKGYTVARVDFGQAVEPLGVARVGE